MKYTLIIALLFIILSSCRNKEYFDFDKAIHYSIDISEEEVYDLGNTFKEKKLFHALGDYITTINDTLKVSDLESLGFYKHAINNAKFKLLNNLFSEKHHDNVYGLAWIAVYRDIIIFKNKGTTVGVAKICFGCDQSSIIGTIANTDEFGMSGDFDRLDKLLKD